MFLSRLQELSCFFMSNRTPSFLFIGFVFFVLGLSSCSLEQENSVQSPSVSPQESGNPSVISASPPSIQIFPVSTNVGEEFFSFSQPEWGYSLQYPREWDFSTDHSGFPTFFGQKRKDSARPAVNIFAEKYPEGPFTYSEMRIFVERSLRKTYPNIIIQNSLDIDMTAGKASRIQYTATINGQKSQILQYIFLRGTSRYIFSFADTPETFENNLSVAETIANSFSFTEKDPTLDQK